MNERPDDRWIDDLRLLTSTARRLVPIWLKLWRAERRQSLNERRIMATRRSVESSWERLPSLKARQRRSVERRLRSHDLPLIQLEQAMGETRAEIDEMRSTIERQTRLILRFAQLLLPWHRSR